MPQGVMMDSGGRSIYENDPPIFLVDGNADYYLDDSAADSARARAHWVSQYSERRGALLDVGANFGHFVREAGMMYSAVGIEPSTAAVAWARDHLGVHIEVGSIYDDRPDFDGQFDVVTMFDVIEHLPDPREAVRRCRQYLRARGRLFLSTPDAGSLVARVLGRRWHHCDLVQHIALFNAQNLTRLLQEAGFDVLAIRTFGRTYRCSYIDRRLAYFARSSLVWRVVHRASFPLRLWAKRRVFLNLGDVIGVVAAVRT